MQDNTRANNYVFNYEQDPLFTRENASDMVLFNTFDTTQSNTAIWTPGAGKRIFLTALQTSALAELTAELSRAGNEPFMSIVLTAAQATYSESFPSPVKFETGEIISLTTNEDVTIYITLFGYEA